MLVRIMWIAVAVLSGGVLLGAAVAALVGWIAPVPVANERASSEVMHRELLPASGEWETSLRQLPLRSPSWPLTGMDGELWSRQLLEAEAVHLGSLLGIDVPQQLEIFPEAVFGDDGWGEVLYPYQLPALDEAMLDLSPQEIKRSPDVVLDLSAALVLSAAATAVSEEPWHPSANGGALAHSLVKRAIQVSGRSCDLQLQLVYIVAMDGAPPVAEWSEDVEIARDLCQEPTADYLRAAVAINQAFAYVPLLSAAEALEYVEGLRAHFPESPLGDAAMAHFLLERATWEEREEAAVFQARQWRADALEHVLEARSGYDDAGLSLLHATVLREMARPREALDVLGSMPAGLQETVDFVELKVSILEDLGEYRDAVTLLEETAVVFPVPVSAAPLGMGYGAYGQLALSLWIATSTDHGAGSVSDLQIIPITRFEWPIASCLEDLASVALVLNGEPRQAHDWTSPKFVSPERLAGLCENSLGEQSAWWDSPALLQDFYRSRGEFELARRAAKHWREDEPTNWEAAMNAGEAAFLSGDWSFAVDQFSDAVDLVQGDRELEVALYWTEVRPDHLVVLQLAAALEADGRDVDARRVLNELLEELDTGAGFGEFSEEMTRLHAYSLLGTSHLNQQQYASAAEWLELALEWAPEGALRGAQESNLALALANQGQHQAAIEMAESALERDPASPIFRDTLAFTVHSSGDSTRAIEVYQQALESDSTSYVSANNLGVLLAERQEFGAARSAFAQAVEAAPDYSIAWHNLGVLTAKSNASLIDAYSHMGLAGREDAELRGADAVLMVDTHVYDTGFDVSKPVPPDWQYGSSSSDGTRAFVWTMALLALARAAWSLGLDELVNRLLARGEAEMLGRLPRWGVVPAAVALAVSVFVLSWPALTWSSSWAERVAYLVVMTAIALFPLSLRHVIGRGELPHRGSLPLTLMAPPLTLAGFGVVPYVGVGTSFEQVTRRSALWIAPVAAAGVAAVFLVIAWLTAIPLVRFAAMASIALIGSMLLPMRPLDGVWLTNRAVGLASSLALGGVALLFALQLI